MREPSQAPYTAGAPRTRAQEFGVRVEPRPFHEAFQVDRRKSQSPIALGKEGYESQSHVVGTPRYLASILLKGLGYFSFQCVYCRMSLGSMYVYVFWGHAVSLRREDQPEEETGPCILRVSVSHEVMLSPNSDADACMECEVIEYVRACFCGYGKCHSLRIEENVFGL